MKADLHLHSPLSEKNGDVIKWKNLHDSLSKIMNNGVKLASFTDHNAFDLDFYKEAKELASTGNIVLFPGMELNVVRKNGKIGHMLIIFSESLNDEELFNLYKKIRPINKNGISIHEINDWFKEFETIKIIHIGKNDYFECEDLDILEYDAFEITNKDHHNYLKVIKNGYTSSIVAFSDTHTWTSYPQSRWLYTVFEGLKSPTFKDLKELLKTKKDFVKEIRNND